MTNGEAERVRAALGNLVASWFLEAVGEPTEAQRGVWPLLAEGRSLLAVAPTGSGKTLAAFMVALARFASGEWPASPTIVVYVSPLKALNEDIRKNLEEPLRSLRDFAERTGEGGAASRLAAVRVATRSGDTSARERRAMVSRPPSILATTPESLTLILNSPRARDALGNVALVIVDETHALAGTRRGAMLSAALGRLELLAGPFARAGLSATVRPPEAAARFIASRGSGPLPGGGPACPGARVEIVAPLARKEIVLSVGYASLASGNPGQVREARYESIARRVADLAREDRSGGIVVAFADSRRRTERLATLVNRAYGGGEPVAWAHHGALSATIRGAVESRLREGSLRCVVATSSLELGIDIGDAKAVALAGTPPSPSGALQRIGRSGHAVGGTCRGLIMPFHEADLLAAAAMVGLVLRRECEELAADPAPLDCLAQVLLGMIALDPWTPDSLYGAVTRFSAWEGLERKDFDSVIALLLGRFADPSYRHLEPRIAIDSSTGILRALPGAFGLLYLSGGVIADRGYFSLRAGEGGPTVARLDEEFVWERREGDTFTVGSGTWRIVRIDDRDVVAVPAGKGDPAPPFWKADARAGSKLLYDAVRDELAIFASVSPDEYARRLRDGLGFEPEAASALVAFLSSQRDAQGGFLPGDPRALPCETLRGRDGEEGRLTFVLHAALGSGAHRALAAALSRAWRLAGGGAAEFECDDLAVSIEMAESAGTETELERLVLALDVACGELRMAAVLEGAREGAAWGAAFRECASRALLLPRASFRGRQPLWLSRRKAKRLLAAIEGAADFPVRVQADRDCLRANFDLAGFEEFAARWRSGETKLRPFERAAPSPFARGVAWRSTDRSMYEDDAMRPSASDTALESAMAEGFAGRDPDGKEARRFAERLSGVTRLGAGSGIDEVFDWLYFRGPCPIDEWDRAIARLAPDVVPLVEGDTRLRRESGYVAHADSADAFRSDGALAISACLARTLFVPVATLEVAFGPRDRALSALVDAGSVALRAAGGEEVAVDADNLERWLRSGKRRVVADRRSASELAFLVASSQFVRGASDRVARDVADLFGPLEGFAASPRVWKSAIFPARLDPFRERDLRETVASGALLWYGAGEKGMAWCRPERLALARGAFVRDPRARSVLADLDGPETFARVAALLGREPADLERVLSAEAREGFATSDDAIAAMAFWGEESERGSGTGKPSARAVSPLSGRWAALAPDPMRDALRSREDSIGRARILLARYGVACRELCEREGPPFSWESLSVSLRRLELAGEVAAGVFFDGLAGVQFVECERLDAGLPDGAPAATGEAAFALRAFDPASLAGTGASPLQRTSGASSCHARSGAALYARRDGVDVRFEGAKPGSDASRALVVAWTRDVSSWLAAEGREPVIERIGSERAEESPWRGEFLDAGWKRGWRGLEYRRDPRTVPL